MSQSNELPLIASCPAANLHIVCTNYVVGINVFKADGAGLTPISFYSSLGDSKEIRISELNILWLPIIAKRDCNEIRSLHVDAFINLM